jgi:hypothetical protein
MVLDAQELACMHSMLGSISGLAASKPFPGPFQQP